MSRPPGARYGLYALAILIAAYVLAFMDRQLPSLVVGPLKQDLGLDDVRIGVLQGFGFALLLALAGLPLGRLIDTGVRVRLLAAGVAVWSVLAAASGLADGFAALLLCRMGVGAAESVMTPCAYSLIGDYLPGRRVGLWTSLYGMGAYLGGGLALLLGSAVLARLPAGGVALPVLGRLAPWRLVFLLVGAPGLLVAAWALTLREPARGVAPGEAPHVRLVDVLRYARSNAAALGLAHLGVACSAMGLYALFAWTPALLGRSFHAGPKQIGALGLEVMIAGPLGALTAGVLGDQLRRHGLRTGRVLLAGLAAAAAAPLAFVAFTARDAASVLAGVAPVLFFGTVVVGAGPAILQEITPNRMRGVQHATAVLVVNVVGLGLGPLAIGWISEHAPPPGGLAFALAVASPAMFAASAALLLAASRPYSRAIGPPAPRTTAAAVGAPPPPPAWTLRS